MRIARQEKISSNALVAVRRPKTDLLPFPIGRGLIYGFHSRVQLGGIVRVQAFVKGEDRFRDSFLSCCSRAQEL